MILYYYFKEQSFSLQTLQTHDIIYIYIWEMLTSALRHWLRIQLKKVLTSFLWEMKKTVKTLIVFFSFPIKTFFN